MRSFCHVQGLGFCSVAFSSRTIQIVPAPSLTSSVAPGPIGEKRQGH